MVTITKNLKAAAIKSYLDEGKSLREVGKEFGIHHETLRNWLGKRVRPRGHNLLVKRKTKSPMYNSHSAITSNDSPRANVRWTREENEILRDAVASGMNIKDTCDLIGRTPAAIMCQKSKLIDLGFIPSDKRFALPSGIKRVRKTISNDIITSEPEVVAEVIKTPSTESVKTNTNPKNIDLYDLAKLVKEFGVNVTLNVSDKGMEVKMSN